MSHANCTQPIKRLAKSLFHRLRLERRRRYLIPEDFYPVYDNDKPAAETAFRVFDKNNNGDISRAELKTTLVKVYRERRFLARSMRDVSVALKSLETILLVFAMIILFFISLSVFGVQVGSSLTSVYSIGIAASFIFKNAASNAFDAVMFLFVTQLVVFLFSKALVMVLTRDAARSTPVTGFISTVSPLVVIA